MSDFTDTSKDYYWIPETYTLPIQITFTAKIKETDGMVLGLFSETQDPFKGDETQAALSWYLSGNTDDYDFRTQIFVGFPEKERYQENIILVPDEEYEV
jgi:hypothetical protein